MTNYLSNLVNRTLALTPVVQPRLASIFEPSRFATHVAPENGLQSEKTIESEAPRSKVRPAPSLEVSSSVQAPRFKTRIDEQLESKRVLQTQIEDGNRSDTHIEKFDVREIPQVSSPVTRKATGVLAQPVTVTNRALPRPTREHSATKSLSASFAKDRVESDEPDNWPKLEPLVRRLVEENSETKRFETPIGTAVPETVQQQIVTAESKPLPQVEPLNPIATASSQPIAPVEPGPSITVTIGRVDVRAIVSPPSASKPNRAPQSSQTALEAYLKERSGRRR